MDEFAGQADDALGEDDVADAAIDDESEGSPGLPVLGLVAALGAALVAWRRRQ